MKNLFFFLLLGATLVLGSCTKDNTTITPIADTQEIGDYFDAMEGLNVDILPDTKADELEATVPNDCEYYPCRVEINGWYKLNLPIANETCEVQTGAVSCCMENIWVIAQVEVEPTDAICFELPEAEEAPYNLLNQ